MTHADLSGVARGFNEIVVDGRGNAYVNGGNSDLMAGEEFTPGIVAAASVATLLDRPVALFGHSLGAVVAFEVATRLRPGAVQHLFASARNAPHDTTVVGDVHLRDDAGLVAELRRLAGTDGGVLDHPDLLPLVLPAVRADHQVIETYVGAPGRAVDCPITVLVGADDTEVTPAEAALWAECTHDRFEVLTYPGDHFYLDDVRSDVIAAVAAHLRR
ncbi:thioesterase II family protein [Pseudonocardia sp. TRM90224]|uniref:thioesterase II family protein n=1 Tax=Pseudonocardia sp. TRM90224 TaxID=2812678 RepID=UPI001E406D5B|nr:thioesterase domain-containing protein [Pseudonocardia sp. TRM90224]